MLILQLRPGFEIEKLFIFNENNFEFKCLNNLL